MQEYQHQIPTSQPQPARSKSYCSKIRRCSSRGAVLVIIWTFLVISSMYPMYLYTMNSFALAAAIGPIIGPAAGLLASIRYGRYKTIATGLSLTWVGNVISVPMFILQSFFPGIQETLSYSGYLVAAVLSLTGLILFMVNIIPFGLDQMPFASGENITAFIQWWVWSTVTGAAVANIPLSYVNGIFSPSNTLILLSFGSVVLLSIAQCTNFLLHDWLTIEPKGPNPLKTVYGVLKFAMKHRQPIRRSAFTYCETRKPSRLDFAKMKYGGQFTNEEVEDVKTFLRMVSVLLSFTTATLTITLINTPTYINSNISYEILVCPGLMVVIIGMPIFEVFIYPLVNHRIPSTLKRVGLANALLLMASFTSYLIGTYYFWYNHNSSVVSLQFWTCFLVAMCIISSAIGGTAMVEFVCAQSPYMLKGLLTGFLGTTVMVSIVLAIGIFIGWLEACSKWAPDSPSCGIWYSLFTTTTATLGFVLWCVIAKWYKKRERDEPDLCRMYAEEYYSR